VTASQKGPEVPEVPEHPARKPRRRTRPRKKAGLTRRALARQVGISEQLMSEIESGWRNATPPNLAKIADVLNCRIVALERKRDGGVPNTATPPTTSR